jgi:hypothetical protein
VALKHLLLGRMREIITKPNLNAQQLMAAEEGIRSFGVPHVIVYLPVRTPSWDPVELVFALLKTFYRQNRVPRMRNGAPVGAMGLQELRQLLTRVWGLFKPEVLTNIVDHVHGLYVKEFEADTPQGRLLQIEFQKRLLALNIDFSLTRTRLPFRMTEDVAPKEVDWRGRERSGRKKRRTDLSGSSASAGASQLDSTSPAAAPSNTTLSLVHGTTLNFHASNLDSPATVRQSQRVRTAKQGREE